MISAADIDGFILEACSIIRRKNGEIDKDLYGGTIGQEQFKTWIIENLLLYLGNYAFGEKRSLVLIDNATIHHDDEIVELIRSVGAEIVYLPPYYPDFNPIDFFISIKRH